MDAVAAVVCLVSPEKVQAIASRIRRTDASKAAGALSGVVSTPVAAEVVDQLIDAWRASEVSADELASMLLAAGHVFTKATNQQSTELVWTGPTTPFVSARRTEQALLQVINAAEQALFITSFVAYNVSTIVKALNAASARGVVISMLLELSQDHGGSITFDAIGKMRTLVPAARLYSWRDKADPFSDGRVHAKVAVADGKMCFITSANLTGHAMEQNMEAGVLLTGGQIPKLLLDHLQALVDTKTVSPV
ncbi:DISARM system phospholipase D-like protein DrmC [Stutzerimonas sp. R40042]|uniref:DISARM system phospholipase D-like protein DrmC n=1 Tax=Gammaproteobacteria TaxID=1236 RepID=UPI00201129CA|nr:MULTISPECIES: DISARM system phospholipase D-like protein DrmC [Gammaproteobacteria]MCL1559297.1 DISARM system phospholipase D-like protein DrmC [Xanthomonas nasturtii]WAE63173.1 DISARM system phospholipase D-like protein DrmC [Stutzerimonas sp. R40042]